MKSHILLIGTAGTGKSYACLQRYISTAAADRSSGIIFLLPSKRAVGNIENNIKSALNSQALLATNLLTFDKLAKLIIKEAGKTLFGQISPTHKLLILRDIVSKADISFFRESAQYPGFIKRLAEFFKELGENLYSPDDLKMALDKVSRSTPEERILLEKGKDTRLLYDMYRKELEKVNLIDEEILLEQALNLLASDSRILSNRELLIVDGFAHYTRVELRIIEQLLKRIPEALVTLCYQKNDPDRFSFIDETYTELKNISSWKEEFLDQNRRLSSRQLCHLDRCIFKGDGKNIPSSGDIKFFEGRDKYDEIEKIAAEILHLYLDEKVPFEEIGILFRSITDYGEIIEDTFRRYGIPFTMQRRNKEPTSPAIRFFIDICELIDGELTTERLLPVLKHTLLGLDIDGIDKLEEFIAANGIRSEADWRGKWGPDIDDTILEIKERFLGILTPLQQPVSRPRSAEEYADLAIEILREFEVIENTVRAKKGDVNKSGESIFSSAGTGIKAIYSACEEVVKFCRLSGRTALDFGRFIEFLQMVIENSITPLPSTANSVQISNIFEARSPEYRVVFLPGLIEKSFPRLIRSNPFLKDSERRILRSSKFDLPLKLQRVSEDRYLFYIACTRASERIYFCHPLTDGRGKAVKRSHYLDEVKKLFDFADEEGKIETQHSKVENALRTRDLYNLAACSFWTSSPDSFENTVRSTTAAEIYNSQVLPVQTLKDVLLYGESRRYDEKDPELSKKTIEDIRNKDRTYIVSVTSLESFAVCPFRYFCNKILRLEEPDKYDFSRKEAGAAVHHAMQSLYSQVYKEKKISVQDTQAIVEMGISMFRDYVRRRYGRIISLPIKQIEVRKNERLFREFLELEVEFQNLNGTTPTYFELSFQPGKPYRDADLRSSSIGLEIECPDGLRAILKGRTDRIDILEDEGDTYGVLIDYKNGDVTNKIKFDDGLDLQVPVYLHALEKIFNIKPAGGFYYGIKSRRKRGVYDKRFEDRICVKIKKQRTVPDTYDNDGKPETDFRNTIEKSLDKVREYISRIHKGDIGLGVKHRDKCRQCPYENLCRK